MRILLSYIRPHIWYFVAAYIAVIASAGSVLAFGKGLSAIVDSELFGNTAGYDPLLVVLLLILIIAMSSFIRLLMCGKGAELVIRDIRQRLYNKIVSLSPGVLEHTSTSSLMTRLMTDTAALYSTLNGSLLVIFRNVIVLISSLFMLLHTNYRLTGYIALVLPLLFVILTLLGGRVRKALRASRWKSDILTHFAEETCGGIYIIQALAAEKTVRERFTSLMEEAGRASGRYVLLRALMVTAIIAAVTCSVGLVLWTGMHDVAEHRMTTGSLLSFIFYASLAAGAVNGIGDNAQDFQRAVSMSEDIEKLLTLDPGMVDAEGCIDVHEVRESVEMHNVTFSYPGKSEMPVLNGITLSMRKGEKVAIVGHSGSGKSTIVDLLLRFYDVSSGSITIDGRDIKEFSLRSLRSLFCLVPQGPVIFSGTILDNITYGVDHYTDEQLDTAVRSASIADFIYSLPDKFNTFVGEKGVCMSEGQRQRIIIARAILRQPSVLILDEATSALDADNEYQVQQALQTLMKGKLTITIAHRLSTVVDADKIVVLNDGVIQEIGTHNTLMMDENGLYAKLFKMQMQNVEVQQA